MTRREKLYEEYEDAFFALMMDQIAEDEGREFLKENEALNNDPGASIPDLLDHKCKRTIRKVFRQKQLNNASGIVSKAVTAIAMTVFVALVLFTSVYAAFPEVRVKALNLLIEVSDVATSLTLVGDAQGLGSREERVDDEGIYLRGYSLTYIPDGFEVCSDGSDSVSAWAEYENVDGGTIFVLISDASGTINNLDTENAEELQEIQVNGYGGVLIEKDGFIRIVWGDTSQNNFIEITCKGLDIADAMGIANNIAYEIE